MATVSAMQRERQLSGHLKREPGGPHHDGVGNACDAMDGDGIVNTTDNCPDAANAPVDTATTGLGRLTRRPRRAVRRRRDNDIDLRDLDAILRSGVRRRAERSA